MNRINYICFWIDRCKLAYVDITSETVLTGVCGAGDEGPKGGGGYLLPDAIFSS